MALVTIIQGMLDNNAVTTANISAGAVTNTKIAAGSVTSDKTAFTDLTIDGDITVIGGLTAFGTTNFINTNVSTTSALSVINVGTGPALVVRQSGNEPVAEFFDNESGMAFFIADSGKVGVGTETPDSDFHVTGNALFSTQLSAANILVNRLTMGKPTINNDYQLTLTGIISAFDILTTMIIGARGGGSDRMFWENDSVMNTSYTITSGKNAMTAGPITINTGATLTVLSGSTWTVV